VLVMAFGMLAFAFVAAYVIDFPEPPGGAA